MSKSRIAILTLAIGSAGVAAFIANGFLDQPSTPRAVETVRPSTVEVLVANSDITRGEKLTPGNIGWRNWPADLVQATMITRAARPEALSELENARARNMLFEGEPVSERKLVLPNDAGFMAAILPSGMRAISVRISAETGAGGFILPDDKVDVLLTRKLNQGGQARSVSETVLSNVRVLAIDQSFSQNDKGEQVVVGKTATLELMPQQAEVLALTENDGQLSLALRSLADNGTRALGDDAPQLSGRFAKGGRGADVTVYRYGVGKISSTKD